MINLGHDGEVGSVSRGRCGSAKNRLSAHSGEKISCNGVRAFAFLPVVYLLAVSIALSGCAITGTKASDSLTPIISVAITQAPPASLVVGSAIPLSAVVSNDTANAGVDWVALCDSAPLCGSFSPAHTASGGTTIFTAPPAVPTHTTIAVTALSSSNHGKQSTAPVTIVSAGLRVTITQPPPPTVPGGASITLAATVFGDPANLGVDWKVTCGTTGALRTPVDCTPPNLHSPAGGSITFFVPGPLQIPTIVGSTVTVTALATADNSVSATALFTVTSAITVDVTQPPPSPMNTNATAPVTAVAENDTTNAGVDWSVFCSNTPCGSVSPAHTNSGQAAIFTAPPVQPSNPNVQLIATSTAAGPQVFATVSVTIVAPPSVQITTGVPINTIVQNASSPLVATVSNDPAGAGVDWTVNCGSPGACGAFSPAHTASGAATSFTAPSAVPAGGTVTITAASTADPTRTATEIVTVTTGVPPNSLLVGQFVMLLTAKNSANGPFALGGFISGDGNGAITAGSLDLADASGNANSSVGIGSPSTYSIGPDGRGQINLTLNTSLVGASFGVNGSGAITLSVVFVTPQHALLSETDSFGNATGTLDLQNTNDLIASQGGTLLNGNYSLILSGVEKSSPNPDYFVGAAVTIRSSAGSYGVSGYVADQSDHGAITSVPFSNVAYFGQAGLQPNGELTMSQVNLGLPTRFYLDVWLIDANHFVVTDWRDSFFGTPSIIVAGYLTAQPSSPAISGAYAFTNSGASATATPQASGGVFACGSAGTLDVAALGGSVTADQAITAACTAPTSGRGLITLSGAGSSGISQFAAYPTVDQGTYLLELDGGTTGTSGSSGAGVARQQTLAAPIVASAFSGNYAANFAANTTLGVENFAGQILSDGVSEISGTTDVNSFNATAAPLAGNPSIGAVLSGSFTAGATGRFPLTLAITPAAGQPVPEITPLHSACYIVDANTCLLLGLDATAPGTGILQLQQTGL